MSFLYEKNPRTMYRDKKILSHGETVPVLVNQVVSIKIKQKVCFEEKPLY
ncbi:not available (plasmid) [Bacillus cereus]|nr:not available [Bacillus cereus]